VGFSRVVREDDHVSPSFESVYYGDVPFEGWLQGVETDFPIFSG